jgi:hypothetical protein
MFWPEVEVCVASNSAAAIVDVCTIVCEPLPRMSEDEGMKDSPCVSATAEDLKGEDRVSIVYA